MADIVCNHRRQMLHVVRFFVRTTIILFMCSTIIRWDTLKDIFYKKTFHVLYDMGK